METQIKQKTPSARETAGLEELLQGMGARLDEVRMLRRLRTLRKFSARVGYTDTTLNNVRLGRQAGRLKFWLTCSRKLRCPLEVLLDPSLPIRLPRLKDQLTLVTARQIALGVIKAAADGRISGEELAAAIGTSPEVPRRTFAKMLKNNENVPMAPLLKMQRRLGVGWRKICTETEQIEAVQAIEAKASLGKRELGKFLNPEQQWLHTEWKTSGDRRAWADETLEKLYLRNPLTAMTVELALGIGSRPEPMSVPEVASSLGLSHHRALRILHVGTRMLLDPRILYWYDRAEGVYNRCFGCFSSAAERRHWMRTTLGWDQKRVENVDDIVAAGSWRSLYVYRLSEIAEGMHRDLNTLLLDYTEDSGNGRSQSRTDPGRFTAFCDAARMDNARILRYTAINSSRLDWSQRGPQVETALLLAWILGIDPATLVRGPASHMHPEIERSLVTVQRDLGTELADLIKLEFVPEAQRVSHGNRSRAQCLIEQMIACLTKYRPAAPRRFVRLGAHFLLPRSNGLTDRFQQLVRKAIDDFPPKAGSKATNGR